MISRLLILFIILLTSCVSDHHVPSTKTIPSTRQETTKINKIAMIAPLNGSNQNLGNALIDAGFLALLQSKKNISIMVIDSAVEQKTLRENIQKAIDDNVKIFVGPVFADDTNLVSSMVKNKDIIVLSFSNDSSLAGTGVYLMGFLPETSVNKVDDHASVKGIYDFYSLLPAGKYGNIIKNSLTKLSNKEHIFLIDSEDYDDKNLSISLEQITSSMKDNQNKKALVISDKGKSFKAIRDVLSDAYLSERNIKLINLAGFSDEEIAKYQSDNIWFIGSETESSKNLNQIFEGKYPYNTLKLMNLAYDGVTLAATIKSSKELKNTRGFNGINGFFRFDKNGLIEREVKILGDE